MPKLFPLITLAKDFNKNNHNSLSVLFNYSNASFEIFYAKDKFLPFRFLKVSGSLFK